MTTLTRPLLPALLALFFFGTPLLAQEPNRNVRFGLPSQAKADPRQREDYLIARPQYVLSYNAKTHGPNWVSWELRQSDIDNASCCCCGASAVCPPRFPLNQAKEKS